MTMIIARAAKNFFLVHQREIWKVNGGLANQNFGMLEISADVVSRRGRGPKVF